MRPFNAFTAWSVSLVILALDSWRVGGLRGKLSKGISSVPLDCPCTKGSVFIAHGNSTHYLSSCVQLARIHRSIQCVLPTWCAFNFVLWIIIRSKKSSYKLLRHQHQKPTKHIYYIGADWNHGRTAPPCFLQVRLNRCDVMAYRGQNLIHLTACIIRGLLFRTLQWISFKSEPRILQKHS